MIAMLLVDRDAETFIGAPLPAVDGTVAVDVGRRFAGHIQPALRFQLDRADAGAFFVVVPER